MSTTALSGDAVLQQVYNPVDESLKVDVIANISGAQEVIINSTSDSITIGDTSGNHVTTTNTGGGHQAMDVNVTSATGVTVSGSVSVSNFPATQAISAAALPLPAGAATSALQTTGNTSLSSIDSKLTSPLAVTGTFFQATQPVSGTVTANAGSGTFAISAAALPLPSGASTSALQTTGNTSLSSIDTKTPSLGQALAAASVPVVLTAAQLTTLTPVTSVTVNNASGASAVNIQDGGNSITVDGTFFQATQPVSISATVAVSAASLPLPTGASSSALQTTGNTSLSSIDTKTPALGQALAAASVPVVLTVAQLSTLTPLSSVTVSGTVAATQSGTWTVQPGNTANTTAWKVDGSAVTQPVSGTFFQATQPVSIAATVAISAASLPLPTGASTSALQTTGNTSLSSIDTKIPALGQALAAASVPVVLTAAQLSTLTPLSSISVSNFPATQPISGTVTANAGTGTFAISAASLPLPTGASTSALQTTGNTSLSSIDTKTPALGQALAAASVPVVLTAAQLTTLTPVTSVTVNNASGVSAVNIQDGGNSITVDGTFWQATQPVSGTVTVNALTNSSVVKAQLQDNAGTAIVLGQTTMSASLPVTIASNQSALAVTQATLTKGTQGAQGVSTQDLKDAGRTAIIFSAAGVASGATTVETAITLVKSAGTAATSSAASFVVTSGKRFRITGISVGTRGNAIATIQTTTFNFRLNTAGAVTTSSTPILFSNRSATPATASAYDRFIIPIPDGYEILGDGTLQIGMTAVATFAVNAPTWDVFIIGFEY